MALNGLNCAYVPLRNYSLTHPFLILDNTSSLIVLLSAITNIALLAMIGLHANPKAYVMCSVNCCIKTDKLQK